MIDILSLLTPEPEKQVNVYIDKVVFEVALREAGVDDECVKDCLSYNPEAWDFLIGYFEGKNK